MFCTPLLTRACAAGDVTLAGWLFAAVATIALCLIVRRGVAARRDRPGPWVMAFGRLRHDRLAMAGLYVIIGLYVIAVLAPVVAPFDPTAQPDIVDLKNRAPSLAHPFGTDPFSRDILSRVIYGARLSLSIALLAMLLAITAGTTYGAIAGFVGGPTDSAMMRLIDAMLSIPRILLLIGILSLWGRVSVPMLVVAIGSTGWFGVSRIVRAQVLALRSDEFVVSARALGARRLRVLVRHILPNVLSPVIVAATLGVGNVIIIEAGLSYLGIGVRPPFASWGNIIQDGAANLFGLWWVSLFPGLAIIITVMAFNFVGDGLRDALDPRQLPGR
ncbi:MAG: ABC transporter permease [Gemmatimonadaceae bacterium]